MEQFIQILLYIHIAAGTVALISGPFAMSVDKGSNRHRLVGKIFFYAMMVVAASAVIIASSAKYRSPFLIVMGVFSAYLPLSGYRILHLKLLDKKQKPKIWDWDITVYMACFTALMFYYGAYQYIKDGNSDIFFILSFFGIIAVLMLRQDFLVLNKRIKTRNFWLYMHITRMIAANIAAFTAFLVVNFHNVLPAKLGWTLPTFIGSVIIYLFIKKYKDKLGNDKEVSEVADVRIIPKIKEDDIPFQNNSVA